MKSSSSSVILVLLSLLALLSDKVEEMGLTYLVFLICLLLVKYSATKSIQLYSVWIIGFVFVILGEMLLGGNLSASKLLIAANSAVLLGYEVINFTPKIKIENFFAKAKQGNLPLLFLFSVEVIYILLNYKRALLTLAVGRNQAYAMTVYDNPLLEGLIGASEMVLPSLFVYYNRTIRQRKHWLLWSLAFSLPIFALIFMKGSRFYLLFSLCGFMIVSGIMPLFNIKLKSILKIGVLGIFVVFAAASMKNLRTVADSDGGEVESQQTLAQKIGNKTSPEGVVDMTRLSMEYFKHNPHTYGVQTANILYFWIPRKVWPDKPTMIGYWLIRTDRGGFASGHSGSFGFCGELFADFGYFMFLLLPFLGGLIKLGDRTIESNFIVGEYRTVMYSMFYPYVFFVIRSPITGTIAFLSILFIYYIFKKLITK